MHEQIHGSEQVLVGKRSRLKPAAVVANAHSTELNTRILALHWMTVAWMIAECSFPS